jgi:hypothetical protein
MLLSGSENYYPNALLLPVKPDGAVTSPNRVVHFASLLTDHVT